MIRVATPAQSLSAPERYGLDVLLDASRLLRVEDESANVVRLLIESTPVDASRFDDFVRGRWTFQGGEGVVRIPIDLLRFVAEVAGAGVEQRVQATDHHGRVPSNENPLVRLGREREPVVTAAGAALAVAVAGVAARRPVWLFAPWPGGHRWAAALTHDLDVVSGWPVFTALRVLELVAGREFRQTARVLSAAARTLRRSPVGAAVRAVLELEARHGLLATWFVIAGRPSIASWRRGDVTYRVDGAGARAILNDITTRGSEIALHGSFATLQGLLAFGEERRRLADAASSEPRGVRQHFLRFRPGATQEAMAVAGFAYDASYGYPDRNGFRLGVADAVPAWDAAHDRELPLDEVPLVWMDRALSKYAGVQDPAAWVDDGLALAHRCRQLNGLWVGLWHPNLVPALGYPGAPAQFERLIRCLLDGRPWVERLDRIVSWRRARRSVRARRVAEDGRVELTATAVWSEPLRLEDARAERASDHPWPGPRGALPLDALD